MAIFVHDFIQNTGRQRAKRCPELRQREKDERETGFQSSRNGSERSRGVFTNYCFDCHLLVLLVISLSLDPSQSPGARFRFELSCSIEVIHRPCKSRVCLFLKGDKICSNKLFTYVSVSNAISLCKCQLDINANQRQPSNRPTNEKFA